MKVTCEAAYPLIENGYIAHEGMTLRDYFAGQALIGILSNSIIEKMRQEELDGYFSDDAQIKAIAETCGDYADAMIKEREK